MEFIPEMNLGAVSLLTPTGIRASATVRRKEGTTGRLLGGVSLGTLWVRL